MKWKNNNKGLTLIELIVTMAIVLIVGAAIISLMVIGIKQYRSSSSEVDIQYEAQLANNQIRDMLIDVSAGLGYYVSTGSDLTATVSDNAYAQSAGAASAADIDFTDKCLCFYNWDYTTDPAGKTVTLLSWNKDEKTIQFSEYTYTSGVGIDQSAEKNLLAEYVTDFSVDLSKALSSKEVSYSITFEKNGRTYKAENNVTLRNDITINNEDEEAIFKEITEKISIVNKVTVSPSEGVVVVQGGTQQFTASVSGENFPGQRVNWSLDGTYAAGTQIDSNGLLTLGMNEESQAIKVVATSAGVGADGNHVSAFAIASAKYLRSATFKCTTNKGNTQTASLSLTGVNLDASLLTTGIIPVSITASIGGLVTNKVSINRGNVKPGVQNELVYQNIEIICNDVEPDTDVTITATVGPYGGFTGKPQSYTFTTAAARKPISSAIIVKKGEMAKYNGLSKLRRGENLEFEVLVQRGENEPYQTIEEDGHVTLTWQEEVNTIKRRYSNYASFTKAADGSIQLSVFKNDELLPYKTDPVDSSIELNAYVLDEGETNEKGVDNPIGFSVSDVKLKNFNADKDDYWAGSEIVFTGEASGIILQQSDLLFADSKVGKNSATIESFKFTDITQNGDEYKFTIKARLYRLLGYAKGEAKIYITKSPNTTIKSSADQKKQEFTVWGF